MLLFISYALQIKQAGQNLYGLEDDNAAKKYWNAILMVIIFSTLNLENK